MIVFFDLETTEDGKRVKDYGAVDGVSNIHTTKILEFEKFLKGHEYFGGHNIVWHDVKYVKEELQKVRDDYEERLIDTLPLSVLLFSKKPYHHLVKDYKLQSRDINNPLKDSDLAKKLFEEELKAYKDLPFELQNIYKELLKNSVEFKGFFRYLESNEMSGLNVFLHCLQMFGNKDDLDIRIRKYFQGKICENFSFDEYLGKYSVEMAFCLALIAVDDVESLLPSWVLKNYPKVIEIMTKLRGTPCREGCAYCEKQFNVRAQLKKFFDYEKFREFDGDTLQEKAVRAAVDKKPILVVFPTGGGKSLTFQLPALIDNAARKALTVVISLYNH